MNILILTSVEFFLLALVAVVISTQTRTWVLFGRTRSSLLLLAMSLLVCIIASAVYHGSYKRLSIPETERIKALVADQGMGLVVVQTPFNAGAIKPLNARRDFVLGGTFGKYQNSGQTIQYSPTERDVQWRAETLIEIARQNDQAALALSKSIAWGIYWIPLALFGFFYARRELRRLIDMHGFQRKLDQKTFAEVEGFVNLLVGACADPAMQSTLETILTQPDVRRKQMVVEMVARLRETHAPKSLLDALVCLMDDQAAEKAYVAIQACRR